MNKKQAKYIFRGTANLSKALGISAQAIQQWPDQLTTKQSDWVTGAALRLNIRLEYPEDLK